VSEIAQTETRLRCEDFWRDEHEKAELPWPGKQQFGKGNSAVSLPENIK